MRYQLALSAERIRDRVWDEFAGVGMIRGEYILREAGVYITAPEGPELVRRYLDGICSIFGPRPVWYRFAELEVAEANALAGVDVILPRERNPVVGTRGVRRAVRFPAGFSMELDAISPVLRAWPNVGVIVPFTSDVSEVAFVKAALEERGLAPPLGIMAEIPSTILLLERFLDLGVSSVLAGMNDLTCLVLGTDRGADRSLMQHDALLHLLSRARSVTRERGATLSVGGYFLRNCPGTPLVSGSW